ncbi:nucleoside 2-deoxyribosyltransferase domain-containing protein [Amycolatopsis keratiniphila]|uniref:nucleoside 2-deoxyribosyltransferase domain-containing protein n=1 Tax=Amycolatopsis keratiniphila TaxID=129921 RepID=UPI0009F83835|nr:nucleoside 2-deoxyribosyltransferase domain-containing protein [Amycolatopsis keratiniphila]
MIRVVQAREPLPAAAAPSVFLAGPTAVAGGPVPSWRPAALELLGQCWREPEPLVVLTPENPVRAARYRDQFEWENAARAVATVVLFWIPRDLVHMPGMTTNVEFGHDVAAGRTVVLGCPPDCPDPRRNRYLIHLGRAYGMPVCATLPDTVEAAASLAAASTRLGSSRGRGSVLRCGAGPAGYQPAGPPSPTHAPPKS